MTMNPVTNLPSLRNANAGPRESLRSYEEQMEKNRLIVGAFWLFALFAMTMTVQSGYAKSDVQPNLTIIQH